MESKTNNWLNNKNTKMYSALHSFLYGMGSILDIHGHYYFISFRQKSDKEKIREDWKKVGDDIRRSYSHKLKLINK